MLTDEQRSTFHRQGYLVLESVLNTEQLRALQNDCEEWLEQLDSVDILKNTGCVIEPMLNSDIELTTPSCRWDRTSYREARWSSRPAAGQVLLELLPSIVTDILPSPNDIRLYNEQYIVKPPQTPFGSTFVWHQDNEYLHTAARSIPTVACWIPLDSVSQANGTVEIEPYIDVASDEDISTIVLSCLQQVDQYVQWHDVQSSRYPVRSPYLIEPCVEYPVVTIVMEPGSVLLMSDRVRHRSRGNASRRTRRVYMVQYSSGIVLTEDPTANMPLALAVPVEHG